MRSAAVILCLLAGPGLAGCAQAPREAGACHVVSLPGTARPAGETPVLNDAEAIYAFDCLQAPLDLAYAMAGPPYRLWQRVSDPAYTSSHVDARAIVRIYADATALPAYGRFEDGGKVPPGGRIAKESLVIDQARTARIGPLFLMEKLPAGSSPATGDWRYAAWLPNGRLVGDSHPPAGPGAASGPPRGANMVAACHDCHGRARRQDSLLYPPPAYRLP